MTLPKVSIITINYNGRKYIRDYFSSLSKLDHADYEIIMVDNASSDASIDLVRKNFPRLRVMVNQKNVGFLANNQAAKEAKGKYLFFLNNDLKVEPGILRKMVRKMEEVEDMGILGCRIMNYSGKKYYHTGIGIDVFGFPIISRKIFYVEGSALMIKKKLFKNLGGFDPKYFMFHEDIDLAWRVWLSGLKVEALEETYVCHAGGGSAGGGPKIKGRYYSSYLRRYYSERNNLRTILKNYQTLTLLIVLPFYLAINISELVFYLFLGKFKLIYLYFKAYLWNLVNLADTFKLRRQIQRQRTVSDYEIISKMYLGSAKFQGLLKTGLPKFK